MADATDAVEGNGRDSAGGSSRLADGSDSPSEPPEPGARDIAVHSELDLGLDSATDLDDGVAEADVDYCFPRFPNPLLPPCEPDDVGPDPDEGDVFYSCGSSYECVSDGVVVRTYYMSLTPDEWERHGYACPTEFVLKCESGCVDGDWLPTNHDDGSPTDPSTLCSE